MQIVEDASTTSKNLIIKDVDALLDTFHKSTSDGNGDLMVGCLSENFVFLGTDASERWER